MVKTIGIKDFLMHVFPVLTPAQNPLTPVEQLAEVNAKIEANRKKLRDAILRYTSMGRLAEAYMNANMNYESPPTVEHIAYELLVGYRNILMKEYKITENDLLSIEKTKALLMDGRLF